MGERKWDGDKTLRDQEDCHGRDGFFEARKPKPGMLEGTCKTIVGGGIEALEVEEEAGEEEEV